MAAAQAKILVVEDSATERQALSRILLREGFAVVEAKNGTEAVALSQRELPDAILMDIVMPEMNGFEATRTISRHPATRGIPIIICSSKAGDTDRLWGLRQGAQSYLAKPLVADEVLACIRNLVKRTSAV